jgi:hypothetical protein
MKRFVGMGLIFLLASMAAASCTSAAPKQNPGRPQCNVTCDDPAKPFCDPTTQACYGCVTADNCVSDSNGGACVEPGKFCGCTNDGDCMASTIGGHCFTDTHKCGCATGNDCLNNAAGPACVSATHACGCGADKDCVSAAAPHCDAATGVCGQCFTDAQCTDPDRAACKTIDHTCIGCNVDTDCAKSSQGRHCQSNSCSCMEGDCASSARGSSCLMPESGGYPSCGCQEGMDTTECAMSPFGPHCVPPSTPTAVASCGCTLDTDCAATQKCDPPTRRCVAM